MSEEIEKLSANHQSFMDLILAAMASGTIALPIILNAWVALKQESGMTDEQLAADTERRGAELDSNIMKRLQELEFEK